MTEQERVKKLVLDSIRFKEPSNTIMLPEDVPNPKQEEQLRKYGIALDVDAPIRDAIIELNQAGFETVGSCCGHNEKSPAFIGLRSMLSQNSKEKAKAILIKHGLKLIKKPDKSDRDLGTGEYIPGTSTVFDFKFIETSQKKFDRKPLEAIKDFGISANEYNAAVKEGKNNRIYTNKSRLLKSIKDLDQRVDDYKKALKEKDFKTADNIAVSLKSEYRSRKIALANKVKRFKVAPEIITYTEKKIGWLLASDDLSFTGTNPALALRFKLIDESDELMNKVDYEKDPVGWEKARNKSQALYKDNDAKITELSKLYPAKTVEQMRKEIISTRLMNATIGKKIPAVNTHAKKTKHVTHNAGMKFLRTEKYR